MWDLNDFQLDVTFSMHLCLHNLVFYVALSRDGNGAKNNLYPRIKICHAYNDSRVQVPAGLEN